MKTISHHHFQFFQKIIYQRRGMFKNSTYKITVFGELFWILVGDFWLVNSAEQPLFQKSLPKKRQNFDLKSFFFENIPRLYIIIINFLYYSSPNDFNCSSWYSKAILSSRTSDTSWCSSLFVRATTLFFSRYSWILHCKALTSLPALPIALIEAREVKRSTLGGNGGRCEVIWCGFCCCCWKLFKSKELLLAWERV